MARREQLLQMLAASPDDEFLRYALAMACAGEGDDEEAAARLAALHTDQPDHVAAWFQHGKILARMGDLEAASQVLTSGIAAAGRVGDSHAAEEMRGLLEML